MTMNSDEPKVEAPTGKKVYCEECRWTGTDHDLLPPGAACPGCKRVFSVTEYTGDVPPRARPRLSFSTALRALKDGCRMRRASWAEGCFVVLQKGYPDGIPINKNTAEATGIPEGTVCKFTPYFMFRMKDGTFTPWVIWSENLLAEDWEVLP